MNTSGNLAFDAATYSDSSIATSVEKFGIPSRSMQTLAALWIVSGQKQEHFMFPLRRLTLGAFSRMVSSGHVVGPYDLGRDDFVI